MLNICVRNKIRTLNQLIIFAVKFKVCYPTSGFYYLADVFYFIFPCVDPILSDVSKSDICISYLIRRVFSPIIHPRFLFLSFLFFFFFGHQFFRRGMESDSQLGDGSFFYVEFNEV